MSKKAGEVPTTVPKSWGRPARWIRWLAVNTHGLHLVWLNIPRPVRRAASIGISVALAGLGIEPAVSFIGVVFEK